MFGLSWAAFALLAIFGLMSWGVAAVLILSVFVTSYALFPYITPFDLVDEKPGHEHTTSDSLRGMNPYESPKAACSLQQATAPRRNWKDYSPEYNGALWTGLKIQAGLAILTALFLDLGQTHRAFWGAFLCQWATVWIILFRRPMNPTRLDLAIVRSGIIPLLIIIAGLSLASRLR